MDYLINSELKDAERFFSLAQEQAKKSTCSRRRCGAVLVRGGRLIGMGFNSPPGNLESQRRCDSKKSGLHKKVTDKTCCVHAEQRAIIDALENRGEITGSFLYFTSVDEQGNRIDSGAPYCTLCSKLALDTEVAFWILEKEEGVAAYSAEEYNELSFDYRD